MIASSVRVRAVDRVLELGGRAGGPLIMGIVNASPDSFSDGGRFGTLAAQVQLARELLEEDDRALEAWVDDLGPVGRDRSLGVAGLSGRPRAVVRRALHRWLLLQPRAGKLSRQGFDALLRAVERGAAFRHSLGRHGFAVIRSGRLRFEAARKASTLG